MKHLIRRDRVRRGSVLSYEQKRIYYKSIIYNNSLSEYERFLAMLKINSLPKDSSYIRIKNRCAYTGRARAVYNKFKMSRIILREFAPKGQLVGLKKASW